MYEIDFTLGPVYKYACLALAKIGQFGIPLTADCHIQSHLLNMNVKHPNQVKNALCVWFANNAFFNKAMCTLGSLPPSILRTPPLSPDARAFDIFIELVDLQTMRIADLVSQARVVGLPWVCVFGQWSCGQA